MASKKPTSTMVKKVSRGRTTTTIASKSPDVSGRTKKIRDAGKKNTVSKFEDVSELRKKRRGGGGVVGMWKPEAMHHMEELIRTYVRLGKSLARTEFATIPLTPSVCASISAFQCNPEKNRNMEIVCFDETRVKLKPKGGGSDYIHASYVRDVLTQRFFIATQAPMDNTISDFWNMIFDEGATVIVMLCDFIEGGANVCSCYFPMDVGQQIQYGNMSVCCKAANDENEKDRIYTLEVLPEGCSNSSIVSLLCFKEWPAKMPPKSTKSVLRLMKAYAKLERPHSTTPLVIHCTTGEARTCTLILIDLVLQRIIKGHSGNPRDLLEWLRTVVAFAVPNDELYIYAISTVFEYFKVAFKDRIGSATLEDQGIPGWDFPQS